VLKTIEQDAESRMGKSIEALRAELSKLRTGRANTVLLEHLRVEYYGTPTPIDQVATVSVLDARTLSVSPWEKSMIPVLEKAIMESDLGLNPVTSGETIRIPVPALTEERRKEMSKLVRAEGENAKIAIRNIRRDANNHMREFLKEKEITEDEEKHGHDRVQGITDSFVKKIDELVAAKEQEIMEV